jgi:hypothetical protein
LDSAHLSMLALGSEVSAIATARSVPSPSWGSPSTRGATVAGSAVVHSSPC